MLDHFVVLYSSCEEGLRSSEYHVHGAFEDRYFDQELVLNLAEALKAQVDIFSNADRFRLKISDCSRIARAVDPPLKSCFRRKSKGTPVMNTCCNA